MFYYSRWYFTCQFILLSDLLFIHFLLYIYCPFTFTFPYYCFLFLYAYLLVRFWRILIFQHQSLRRPTSHCSKEPKETTRRESKVSCLMYFGILSCYDDSMPKLYLLYFCFVIFSVLYPDKNYCRCMSFMWKWNF